MGNIVSARAGNTSTTADPPGVFTLYIPPIGMPMKIKLSTSYSLPLPIQRSRDLNSTITQLVSDVASKTKKHSDRYPTENDWALVDITKRTWIKGGPSVQEYIESGATYIVLSAQGVSEFQLNDGGGKDGNEERVRKWINDMFSKDGDFMTPGSSDDGTFVGAT